MKTYYLYLYLLLFSFSIAFISKNFTIPSTPTYYFSIIGSYLLLIVGIVLNFRLQIFSVSLTDVLLVGFFFTIEFELLRENLPLTSMFSAASLSMFYAVSKRIESNTLLIFSGLSLLVLAQSIYGIGQYFYCRSNIAASSFHISGSFDNPAGFAAALVAVFPFSLYLIKRQKLYWGVIGVVEALVSMVAVVLSGSRAGVVGLAVVAGCWLFATVKITWFAAISMKLKISVASLLLVAVVGGLYFVKKDSADGRLLIWQCSAKMIVDKPLLGHGIGGFQKEYMLYQAQFFKDHPHSNFVPLADIVKHPFNEFLLLIVECGLAGLLSVGFFVLLLVREYRRTKTEEKQYAAYCLMGLGAFACFSYPLNYPFVRLMAVFSAALIMKDEPILYQLPQQVIKTFKVFMLIACLVLLGITGKMFYDEYEWNVIAQRSLNGETRKVLPDYARLYKTMKQNGLFLYNYAAELNYIGEWQRSNQLMKECTQLYNDNDVQLILADNYQQLKQYRKAEDCLKLAYQMVPNRFIPLYRLVLLYQMEGKDQTAVGLAEHILKKEVKIPSPEIANIQQEMRALVERYKIKRHHTDI